MPFVTEMLWQEIPTHPSHGDTIMTAPWPKMDDSEEEALSQDPVALQQFECFMDIVKSVRNARVEHDVRLHC